MSIFAVLRTGAGALQAARRGISTASNNIANADTPGYARQRLELRTTGSMRVGGFLLGRGVTADSITNAYDRFTQAAATQRTAIHAESEQRAQGWMAIEPVFAEGVDGRLGAALSRLFDSFAELGSDPTDSALRRSVLGAGGAVSTMFVQADALLAERIAVTDRRIQEVVVDASALLQQVASLNAEIGTLEASGGQAGDLRAQRIAAVEDLARLVPVHTAEQSDGSLTVLLAGQAMVQGSVARGFSTTADPVTGLRRVEVAVGAGSLDITDDLAGSRLGALVEERDTTVPGLRADLDSLAYDLANAINAVHAAGYGSDGVTGRNLFVSPVAIAGAAAAFAVDPAVVGNPAAVAAATAPGLPSDNTGSRLLAGLGSANLAGGGTTTFLGFYADMVGEVGTAAASAYASESRTQARLTAALDLRDSVSGVSIDEEALDLLRFQDAYQAAGRVLSTASRLMDELFRIV
jgi:flagellar hook-associated protein 1 FlgK